MFDNVFYVMKSKVHSPLKGSPSIFQSKGHFLIRKCTPRANESSFMLVFRFYLNLIISGETIHKRKHLTSRTCIYDLVYKWCGIVVLRTCFIEVSKVCTDANSPLLLINRNRVGYPFSQSYGIDKTNLQQLFNFCFTATALRGLTGLNFCQTGLASGYVRISCSTINGSIPRISSYE